MNAVLSVDVTEAGGTVTVQPGVVLDQLNALLSKFGLFFPPMVSTASRATIGGMVGTDASGKGSLRYGKTSDYIEVLDVVLSDGQDWSVREMSLAQAASMADQPGLVGAIHREAIRVARDNAEEIERVFPKMNRGLTGYNLQRMYDREQDRFSLAPLLAGSEGTLAVTKSITLRVVPKPRARGLAIVRYDSFDSALRDVGRLLETGPLAIEILDDKVVGAARGDVIWDRISAALGEEPAVPVRAINFIEYSGEPEDVERCFARLEAAQQTAPAAVLDFKSVRDPDMIASLWTLREKSVGLLARIGDGKQGMPFVEDTAVPPSQLADYVSDFRALLDSHGLKYGMFGHADVGCLHVRPFLDLKDPRQAALIRPVSDGVAELTKAYGGLLWGEHGRGFRGEYSPFYFGPTLYRELERIKAAFDPGNILNPGKLAAPDGDGGIDRIDAVPLRADYDRTIDPELLREFNRAVACNGNGACFSWDALDPMCPSYKATRDRAQSPKGRAALLRAWSHLSHAPQSAEYQAIEKSTAQSLSTCLSCKACTTLCPVKVDVPTMKSRFLERYHASHGRPLRHRLLASLETVLALGRALPGIANFMTKAAITKRLVEVVGHFVDLPQFVVANRAALPPEADLEKLAALTAAERSRTVVLVEDSFTSSFDGKVVEAATELLTLLGYALYRVPVRPNGKALHVLGMREQFAKIAQERVGELERLAASGVTLVGLDAATSLMFEQEYKEFAENSIEVLGLEALLMRDIAAGKIKPLQQQAASFQLLSHCTEQALRPGAAATWQAVYAHFGLTCTTERTGCCGMAGMFGHEREHQDISRWLFALSWQDKIEANPTRTLATGFSCRCQVKRLSAHTVAHPCQILLQAVKGPVLQ